MRNTFQRDNVIGAGVLQCGRRHPGDHRRGGILHDAASSGASDCHEASSTIEAAQTRTNVMTRKLKAVEGLSDARTQVLLPGAQADAADEESA